MREVTEDDFRLEKFKGVKTEDYEFRGDGELVRKDRWVTGMKTLAVILLPNNRDFEIDEIISKARELMLGESND